MFGLFQTTPQYAGEGQPSAANSSGGAFGVLSGLLTLSATPNYATATKVVPPTGAPIFVPTQCEAPVNGEQLAVAPDCRVPLPVAIVIQRSEQQCQ